MALTAVWKEEKNPFKIKYSIRNQDESLTLATQTSENGGVTLHSDVPQRFGYTFLGWSTNSSASSPSYYPGEEYEATESG